MILPDAYWKRTRRLTIFLLSLWLGVTFVVNWYAEDLNELILLGFPLGFYMAAQGELLIYLLIIWIYNRQMNRLDAEFGIDDE